MTADDSTFPTGSPPPSATAPLTRIAIFSATSWEAEAVRAAFGTGVSRRIDRIPVQVYTAGHREYWLARTGMGPMNAREAAVRVLMQHPFSLAVSTGFACALIPSEVGALLLGREVVAMEGDEWKVSPTIEVPGDECERLIGLAEECGPSSHIGRFVSTDRVVGTASEKQRCARATGAVGLDMESAALATEARRVRVPFVIARAASDLLDEDLPLDFNLFLRPTGWLNGAATIIGNPMSIKGLCRLRRQSLTAAKNLTVLFRCYAQHGA